MNGTERSAESKNKRNQYQIKEIPQKEKPEIATKKLKSRAFESNMEEKIGWACIKQTIVQQPHNLRRSRNEMLKNPPMSNLSI